MFFKPQDKIAHIIIIVQELQYIDLKSRKLRKIMVHQRNPLHVIALCARLEEKASRTEDEMAFDLIADKDIVFPDLVFTLKEHPGKYHVPSVKVEGDRLVVIGDPLFFRAAREAGMEELNIDLYTNPRTNIDRLLSEHDLRLQTRPQKVQCVTNLLYFVERPSPISIGDLPVLIGPENRTAPYQEQHCIKYTRLPTDMRSDQAFVERAVQSNGSLRSINGIRNIGRYHHLFTQKSSSTS